MATIIAIGGVSRSGKSTLALWLHKQLHWSMMLSQDDFPNPREYIPKVRDRVDWEHPDSINWQAWRRAVVSNAQDHTYLILEGLFMFRPESEVLTPDFRFYLSMDRANFLQERSKEKRWGEEPRWFIEHVWESHFKYGLPAQSQKVTRFHQISKQDYDTILSVITS